MWGVLLFLLLFVGAHVAHLPGMVFVAAAVLSWGRLWGGALGWLGAVLAVSASFLLGRAVGGRVQSQRPLVQKLFQLLEKRPIRTVIALRTIFWMAPAINIGLALSPLRFRDFVIGSTIGLFAPILVLTLFLDRLIAWFTR